MDMETLLWFVLFVVCLCVAVRSAIVTYEALHEGAFDIAFIGAVLTAAAMVSDVIIGLNMLGVL